MYIAIRGAKNGEQIGIWGVEMGKSDDGQMTLILPEETTLNKDNKITIKGDRIIAVGEENLSLDQRMNPFVEHTSAAKHIVFESENNDITSYGTCKAKTPPFRAGIQPTTPPLTTFVGIAGYSTIWSLTLMPAPP